MSRSHAEQPRRQPDISISEKHKKTALRVALITTASTITIAAGIGIYNFFGNSERFNFQDINLGNGISDETGEPAPSQTTGLSGVVITPEPSVAPTPTTTTETTPTTTPTVEALSPVEEAFKLAPDITGLTKEIQNDKVVYLNESGDYCGYYTKEVSLDGEQTGGVALSPDIVESMIEEKIKNKDEACIPIPLNPCDGQKINIEYKETRTVNGKEVGYGYLYLSSDKKIDFVSPYSGESIMITTSRDSGSTIQPTFINEKLMEEMAKQTPVKNMFDTMVVIIEEGTVYINNNKNTVKFGDFLGIIDGIASLSKGTIKPNLDEADKERLQFNKSELLKINNSIIFIMGGSSDKK